MRDLSTTLEAAQQAPSLKPAIKIVLTKDATSYTYEEDRILSVEHSEGESSHKATVVLRNADGALTDLELGGYQAVLSWGLVTKAGKEYEDTAPLKVLAPRFDSAPGNLLCTLKLIGIPDRLKLDKADGDYSHHWSSVKKVKALITEIADGQPVEEELTEKQETANDYIIFDDLYEVAGQRLSIVDKTVTKLSFCLKKTGNPSGDVTFKIFDMVEEAVVASKVLGNATSLTTSPVWYEVTFDTPVALDREITWDGSGYVGGYLIYVQHVGGTPGNCINVRFNSYNVKANEWGVIYSPTQAPGDSGTEYESADCVYRYKYTFAGIEVFDHCEAYEVVYDDEDSLIDTYEPADSLRIREGDNRLEVIDELLYHTACERRFEADGKIHVIVPTTTGEVYKSEYSLASGHPFFSKAIRKGLVIPNRVVVRSLRGATSSYEGEATSPSSYALLPVSDFKRTTVSDSDQAKDIAKAIISHLEINAQQGGASVPMNCGSELYDYINVTDEREGDSRAGNIGYITRRYRSLMRRGAYEMSFGFGRVALKSVSGTRASEIERSPTNPGKEEDDILRWSELSPILIDIVDVINRIQASLGWQEGQTSADEQIDTALLPYHTKSEIATALLDYYTKAQTFGKNVDGHLDLEGNKIVNMDDPTESLHAATKHYVDLLVADYLLAKGLTWVNDDGDIDMDLKGIVDLDMPDEEGATVPNVAWVQTEFADVDQADPARALTTIYQNTSGKKRFVTVTLSLDNADFTTVYIGSATPPTQTLEGPANDTGGANLRGSISFIVEPSWYYKVVSDGSIVEWFEWDFN